jgi:hypothetical protein
MARDYDRQLLESVAVRRRRLRDAALFGSLSVRRTFQDQLSRTMASVVVGAVFAAGCVGWAYLEHRVLPEQNQQNAPVAPAAPTATGR